MITRIMGNDNHSQKTRTTSIAVIAIVAALSMLGVVVMVTVVTIPLQQQAEAKGCLSSLPHSVGGVIGFNASQGRCFQP
jgi:hypothetical protein